MESLYWMGMDQPAKGTILAARMHIVRAMCVGLRFNAFDGALPAETPAQQGRRSDKARPLLQSLPPCATWKSYSTVFFRLASSANRLMPPRSCCSAELQLTALKAELNTETVWRRILEQVCAGPGLCKVVVVLGTHPHTHT